jgi:outer membrane protein OmpA-like peptidoglycan-associated protein
MRRFVIAVALLMLSPGLARAQVTIDLRALNALPESPPAPVRPPLPSRRPPPPRPTASIPSNPAPAGAAPATTAAGPTPPVPPVAESPATPAAPATPSAPAPPAATIPQTPPAVANIAPVPPPVAPTSLTPPPAPPVSATASTTAVQETAGLQLSFAAGQSDLSPAANDDITRLVKTTPPNEPVSYNVTAYAAGKADDPSAARRTSLARGLAVRGALLAAGVPSSSIYVRALGAPAGGQPDRVDVTVTNLSGGAATTKP